MKLIILFLLAFTGINANVYVTQNIKALYRGVELTASQKSYILDNQDENTENITRALSKEIKNYKSLDEKNIISFLLSPAGEVSNIKFLKTSDNRKLDKTTKDTISTIGNKLVKPKEATELRYIISYEVGQEPIYSSSSSSVNQSTARSREPYYQNIARGTTRFQHSSEEYARAFENSADGFVNASTTPQMCATLKLLTIDNQLIRAGHAWWELNGEIPKGKYKLLVKTNKLCDVHVQY